MPKARRIRRTGSPIGNDVLTLSRVLRGRRITLRVLRQGGDRIVAVSGGDAPHIGAVAVAADGMLLSREREGHREGELAAEIAERASERLGCCVCATCGIHYDGITREEISAVIGIVRDLTERWLDGRRR